MPVTQIKVCNLALIRVGADRISSITEDKKSAILLNAIYDQCRDEVQRARRWNFNTKRAVLAPTSTTPAFGYTYEYDLPADWLRTLEPDDLDIDYVQEDSKIRTDESSLNLSYLYRNEDENSWDSQFASALAWKLAAEIAYALTQSLALAQACQAAYEKYLEEASSTDSTEGSQIEVEISDWTDARK